MNEVNYAIVPCERYHIADIAKNVRDGERGEAAAWYCDPYDAAVLQWSRSFQSYAGIIDGKVAAAWGVIGNLLDRELSAWLLTSDAFTQVQSIGLVRLVRRELRRIANGRVVKGACPDFYPNGLRFLRLIGFKIVDDLTAPNGEIFRVLRFEPNGI